MDLPAPRLSVVLPAYNEARRLPSTLAHVLEHLQRTGDPAEVLVVDDGSTDATAGLVSEGREGTIAVRLLRHPDGGNHGKGASVRLGMLAARGHERLFMDCDSSTGIAELERLRPWIGAGYHVVIGSRAVPGARIDRSQPWYKVLGGRSGNRLIRALLLPGIRDTQAGFKLFRGRAAGEIFHRLTLERWGFDFEALAVARHLGYRIREVPITWRDSGESRVRLRDYLAVLAEVWRVRRNLRRGRYD